MSHLRHRHEDRPSSEPHAHIAQHGWAEGVVKDAPQRDFDQNSSQTLENCHLFVALICFNTAATQAR